MSGASDEKSRVDLGPLRAISAPGLTLRPFELSDAPIWVGHDDDELLKTWNGLVIKATLAEAEEKIARSREWVDFADWAIVEDGATEVVGGIALHHLDAENSSAQLGYTVFATARGRGIAPRAIAGVVDFAFDELGLERLEIYHAVENAQSCRAAQKAGFVLEGTTRHSYRYWDGELHDEHIHGLLRTDPRPLL